MNEILQNTILLFCAGGGKTTKLIERYKEIEKVCEKSRILTISFTNNSCNDINARYNIGAQTLHSFFYSFTNKDVANLENISYFLEDFPNLKKLPIKNLVENYFIFDNFPNDFEFLNEEKEINLEFQCLINILKKEKQNHKICFFSDIINICLEDFFHIAPLIGERYDHILIDECQDFSLKQLELLFKTLEIFCEKSKSFFIVGDVKQSIYWFQGSSSSYYLDFINDLEKLCKYKKVPLRIENQTQSYRFGGEILQKVNFIYGGHNSCISDGTVIEVYLTKEETISFLQNETKKFHEPMIIYERMTSFIGEIQNNLEVGKCKIYTKENVIVQALWDIVYFQQSNSDYYLGKILQGPFFYYNEPDFYNMAKNKNFPKLDLNMEPLEIFRSFKKIHCSKINFLLLQKLFEVSKNYCSLWEMMENLDDFVEIHGKGCMFFTIHGSKGLESDIVFYIKQPSYKEKLFVNLNPFYFTKKFLEKKYTPENIEYVAVTRARKKLYIINTKY